MGKILTHIPGFRTRTPLHMILAGIYYLISVSMTPVSAALGILLLSGPFLLFNGHAAIDEYAKSKNAKALISLFVSAAVCGGSLIGFVTDIAGRQENAPAEFIAFMDTTPSYTSPAVSAVPASEPPPSPLSHGSGPGRSHRAGVYGGGYPGAICGRVRRGNTARGYRDR